jgi:hypothetical protein
MNIWNISHRLKKGIILIALSNTLKKKHSPRKKRGLCQ